MSAPNQGSIEAVPGCTTHVLNCPSCKQETLFHSPLSFLRFERAICQRCGGKFVIENDQPRALSA